MSKAPGKASDYDGSGGWFKIKDWGNHPYQPLYHPVHTS
jgi:hypothetical protein